MLSLPVCPLRHTFRVSAPAAPSPQHASCFQPRAAPRPHLARAIKNPTARLAVGDKVKDSAVPPRLTRHRCRVHSSTANTVRLLTRALRPRLLVTFRLGPPGPILSGSVRFVKLFLCYHRISPLSTDFDPLFQIFRPIQPQRAPSAHPCAHMLVRTPYHCCSAPPDKFFPARFTQMPSALAQAPFPRTSARAVRKRHAFNKRESGWRRKHMRKTTGGSA